MTSQTRNRLLGLLIGAAGVILLCLALFDYFKQPDPNGINLSLAVLILVMAAQQYIGGDRMSGKWLNVVLVLLLTLQIILNGVVKARGHIGYRWMLFSLLGFGILLIASVLQLMRQRRVTKGRNSDTPMEK